VCKDVIRVGEYARITYPALFGCIRDISLNKAAKLSDGATLANDALIAEAMNLGWED
jgi:hypothetical protein